MYALLESDIKIYIVFCVISAWVKPAVWWVLGKCEKWDVTLPFFFFFWKYLLEDSSNMEVISRFICGKPKKHSTSKSWEGTSASLCICTILYKVVIWFLSSHASGFVLFLFCYLHPIRLCDDHISVRGLQNCLIFKKNSFEKVDFRPFATSIKFYTTWYCEVVRRREEVVIRSDAPPARSL